MTTPTPTPAATQPLAVGTPAPAFDLPATGNQQIGLASLTGQPFVLVFYPKDKTPGCTKQLCALNDEWEALKALNATVLASNPGSLKSHEAFVEAYQYQFPILVDADKTMAHAYQALKPEGGIQRTVYVVDAAGIIRFAQQGMPTVDELKAVLQSL